MLDFVSSSRKSVNTQPLKQNSIIAAIDLGTNSLHMVVVKIDPTLPSFSIITKEKETVRLGNCDVTTGKLKPENIDTAITVLKRFQQIAKTAKAETIIAVATSAVREAPNGRDFLQEVQNKLGLKVDLISGQEEARRIYLGVLSGMEFDNQPHVIIDIGGGSTELILGDSQKAEVLSSTKVGAVRLTSEFITTNPISDCEFGRLQAYARGMLERPVENLLANIRPRGFLRLVGTSGTIETLATIHARETLGAVPSILNGYQFSIKDLQNWVSRLRNMTNSEISRIPSMPDRRSEVILAGAVILQEAMKLLGVETITVCDRALREGMIVHWMLAHNLIEDKLRYQSSVRERSVLSLSNKYNLNLEHSHHVAFLALSLFDQTQGVLHDWETDERRLLWPAAILHDCGLYVNHSSYHKHSYYLIRNSELLGYTETEIEIIANLARYHRKSHSSLKKNHPNYQALSKHHRQIIDTMSPLLRLAVALDRREVGAIADIQCKYHADMRVFELLLISNLADDDCALELWKLDYEKSVFEDEFKVKLVANLKHSTVDNKHV
ncbi:Ppx/GppA phosphatase family protein [Umezakia ovalisporum]|uniref:Ppx/GppA family phosphatase n=1 Tax=Umezakia ovalisporum FSS-43 TaxID=2740520 RepID=A0ABT6JZD8_9CYAN|nr:Ppx/GppA phosphatase family protein [Umezakia ovalisporum]MDH6055374.1 Ppx/GppA family phosphatase [Umezakia ovalisporum FSS-43]MDH6069944.1 Ppx/GppA family phosphatase [Umezakia ovalisporum CobakiLakeA]MDH6072999.1 Ppx/GppA family phosphatase [Umezakia ovalisporum CS-1034]MDH6083219.1 Ppx/GppA family phosphatase [Umezakia ovalisporum FSS-44]MDH6093770.1 Ppx/GppA family phosphatase [Umezakia ovalisporum CobakiLakeB]